ncbi:MAG: hypothetical protein RJQ09_10540 [Cyclobacteriaceae bacterium]
MACNSKLPTLEGFDREAWLNDPSGCNADRIDLKASFEDIQDKLLGLNQNEISELLGIPDEHELYKRSQKFFFYYLEPGPKCEQPTENAMRLQIRFSAMGIANELFIENL